MVVERAIQRIMDDTEAYSLLVFIVVVLLAVISFRWIQENYSLPPGPYGLPIFGYYLFMKNEIHRQYYEMMKKYGRIFSINLGSQRVVVISDPRLIREAFRREEFTGRPHSEFNSILSGYGIINSEGSLWKDQRRFLHDKLRNFGMSHMGGAKKLMEIRIQHEIEGFIRGLELRQGAPTDFSAALSMTVSNVICTVIMGMRFHHGDPQFKRFMDLIEEGFKLFGKLSAVNYIPVMRYMPFVQGVRNKIAQNRKEMADFFQRIIEEHKVTFNKDNIRDLVDSYLLEIVRAKKEERELFQGKDYDRQIQQILGDLFSAGMETIKTTVEWAVILMLHNPRAAKAVQEELDQVVGRTKMPSLDDQPYLPITEATIYEIMRRSSIVPLGTTHATLRDVTLGGYHIPAGSQVVPLLYAVHMNPELWDEPEAFRPERFLTAEGKVHKPECFMPFGVGRRMCLGDVLARMEIFLFFSSLMHSFDMRLPEGASLPNLRGNVGVTITPDPFKVCMIKRNFDIPECDANDIAVSGPLRNIGSH
ncbi:cytochrome P450 18a1 [Harpegnathos saltator]|uniref:Cytochrome P450 18a1 n=1 Tax=Harpegnathos saltator TaxID=610380 RepID=E2B7S1_HARSA|nr:cytochrome P450 18a1 [Harpegnathos saltator]EFN88284.1 Cytochrome P450 18a1 [Harpegnathos saltator]